MNATETDCDVPCAGDSSEMCGAPLRLNLYQNITATPPPPPTMVQSSSAGPWDLLGCYKYANVPCLFVRHGVDILCVWQKSDSNGQRVLQELVNVTGGPFNTSVESCTEACYELGFVVAGLEIGSTRLNSSH